MALTDFRGQFNQRKESTDTGSIAVEAINEPFPSDPIYASFLKFSDGSCTEIERAFTRLAFTCFSNGVTSVKYTCSTFSTQELVYSDPSCHTLASSTSITPVCSTNGYIIVGCVSSPFAYGTQEMIVAETFHASQPCSNSNVIKTQGYINGKCYTDIQGQPGVNSVMYDFPNKLSFASADCSGTETGSENLLQLVMDCPLTADSSNNNINFGNDDQDDVVTKGAYHSFSYVGSGATRSQMMILSSSSNTWLAWFLFPALCLLNMQVWHH